jgi:hypothetical protein
VRNSLIFIIAGLLLGGCLSDSETSLVQNNDTTPDQAGNSAPTIRGNPPPAILVGEMYDFEPAASDPDSDSLVFSIANKPNWMNFETTTGRLSGQPTLGNVGSFSNISITVSDGDSSSSLRAFSITVSQAALGNVTLNWNAPTQNTDGSPLMDLAGYKIFYGTDSGNYDHEIRLDNPGMTTYVVDNLVPDTYFFAAKSFNSSGMDSDYSSEAVRTVN